MCILCILWDIVDYIAIFVNWALYACVPLEQDCLNDQLQQKYDDL